MQFQRAGGIAALVAAATYIFGFAFLLTVLADSGLDGTVSDPAQMVAYLGQKGGLVQLWLLVIYVLNGAALVVLLAALRRRLAAAPGWADVSAGFGIVWAVLVIGVGMMGSVAIATVTAIGDPARAAALWDAAWLVQEGLGGGNEIVGALWAITLGGAGLRTGALPRLLCLFGMAIGLAGLSTVLPAAAEAGGAIFGLGYIAWFLWTGVTMLLWPEGGAARQARPA